MNQTAWRGLLAFVVMLATAMACSSSNNAGGEACVDATYTATSMSWSGGDAGVGLDSTSPRTLTESEAVWTNHAFADGSVRIRVRAAGQILQGAQSVWPSMIVSVDDTPVGTALVSNSAFADTDFDFTATTGTHVIKVTYESGGAALLVQSVEVLCQNSDGTYGSGGGAGGGGGGTTGGDGGVSCTPGASCSDGNPCNGEETCNESGVCVAGTPPVLDDGDACTIDSCDPTTGIVHKRVNTPGCIPVLDAPKLDPTVPTQMGKSTEFLYSGDSPVQRGVAAGTIDEKRVGVMRGRVLDANGVSPKAGATVTIVGHPEFGYTISRDDGWYDMAVNGGTTYVVDVRASGYLPIQRPALVKWHGWAVVEDMVLTQPYTSPDPFTVGSATPKFVRGAVTPAGEDGDDARQVSILFPENTHISNLAVADGTALNVQLTEYTRGPYGKQRMPGQLPPTSGYTYAFEATLPEAAAQGVDDVQFDHDVFVYVDNFTHYPVGEPVPNGYYDRTKGAWLAERSGRIIKILSVSNGAATLDVTGDGVADTGTALSDLGITASELASLAAQYAAGTELWRVPIRHFSPYDGNWGFLPEGAAAPPNFQPTSPNPDPCKQSGSIIGCESQTLGENLPIVGTPFNLHYQSDRNPGFQRNLTFKITDATLPVTLPLRIIVQVDVLGRRFEYEEAPEPNKTFTWTWDGLDAYGRQVTSSAEAHIQVGYEYGAVPNRSTPFFGAVDGVNAITIDGIRVATTVTMWKEASFALQGGQGAKSLDFGGWMLDVHHIFDVDNQSLYQGDGQRRTDVNSTV